MVEVSKHVTFIHFFRKKGEQVDDGLVYPKWPMITKIGFKEMLCNTPWINNLLLIMLEKYFNYYFIVLVEKSRIKHFVIKHFYLIKCAKAEQKWI